MGLSDLQLLDVTLVILELRLHAPTMCFDDMFQNTVIAVTKDVGVEPPPDLVKALLFTWDVFGALQQDGVFHWYAPVQQAHAMVIHQAIEQLRKLKEVQPPSQSSWMEQAFVQPPPDAEQPPPPAHEPPPPPPGAPPPPPPDSQEHTAAAEEDYVILAQPDAEQPRAAPEVIDLVSSGSESPRSHSGDSDSASAPRSGDFGLNAPEDGRPGPRGRVRRRDAAPAPEADNPDFGSVLLPSGVQPVDSRSLSTPEGLQTSKSRADSPIPRPAKRSKREPQSARDPEKPCEPNRTEFTRASAPAATGPAPFPPAKLEELTGLSLAKCRVSVMLPYMIHALLFSSSADPADPVATEKGTGPTHKGSPAPEKKGGGATLQASNAGVVPSSESRAGRGGAARTASPAPRTPAECGQPARPPEEGGGESGKEWELSSSSEDGESSDDGVNNLLGSV